MTKQEPFSIKEGGKKHLYQLDAIRGLAAISVAIGHYLNLFPATDSIYSRIGQTVEMLRYTPFFLFFSAHSAVIMFFLLSGYVLSLQFINGKHVQYDIFIVRRLFRIYVPYLVTLIIAIVLQHYCYSNPIKDLSSWFNNPWSGNITFSTIINHIVFLGSYKNDQIDPVLWSLVHELRISLLFPFLMLVALKIGWKKNIILAILLSTSGVILSLWQSIHLNVSNDYILSLHYTGIFLLGHVIARWNTSIAYWYSQQNIYTRLSILTVGLILYTYNHFLPGKTIYFRDIITAIGSMLILITALYSPKASYLLKNPIVEFFGKISYSLYLYHAVILLTFVHLFYTRTSLFLIIPFSAITTVAVSFLSYTFIEKPAITLGKNITIKHKLKFNRASIQ